MNDIRKISVGKGHPDEMMHYQVGKDYRLSGNVYTLTRITFDSEMFAKGKVSYNLYITNEFGTVLWKTITEVPCVVEYNINFD